jgi:hypothetical protein
MNYVVVSVVVVVVVVVGVEEVQRITSTLTPSCRY